MLEKNPDKWLSIEEILKSKWFSDVDEELEIFSIEEKQFIMWEFTYNQ